MNKESPFVHLDIRTEKTRGAFGSAAADIRGLRRVGMETAGIADTSISSWVDWERECNRSGVKPLYGYEFELDVPADRRVHRATALVQTEAGFRSVTNLANHPHPDLDYLRRNLAGVVLIAPALSHEKLRNVADKEQLFLEVVNHSGPRSQEMLENTLKYAAEMRAKMAASYRVWRPQVHKNDVLLSAILQAKLLNAKFPKKFPEFFNLAELSDNRRAYEILMNLFESSKLGLYIPSFHPDAWIKPSSRMHTIYEDIKGASAVTSEIADSCKPEHLPAIEYPVFPEDKGKGAMAQLEELNETGLSRRYTVVPAAVRKRTKSELKVIGEREHYPDLYRFAADVADFNRVNDIAGFATGSVTCSQVAYNTGLTVIDAVKYQLPFQRFVGPVSSGRLPDIDFHIDAHKRDKLLKHIFEVYPRKGIQPYRIAEYPRYRVSGAYRLILSALGIKSSEIDDKRESIQNGTDQSPEALAIKALVDDLVGREHPNGVIQTHPSKVVFSAGPVESGYSVIERNDFPVLEIDKGRAESTVNLDLINNYGLTVITNTLKRLGLERKDIPENDPQALQAAFEGKTVGSQYLETPLLRRVLYEYGIAAGAKPKTEEDIVNAFTLSRPGVRDSQPIFLKRLSGKQRIRYTNPKIKEIFYDTQGLILFQEQAIMAATSLAGFSEEGAEDLRRGLSKERDPERMEELKNRFIAGALNNGLTRRQADMIADQMSGLVKYTFPRGHAETLIREVAYQMLYLKEHFPRFFFEEFMKVGVGYYFKRDRTDEYIKEARRLGVERLKY